MPIPSDFTPASRWHALTAFLHGIEARAWVFALNQCGDGGLARHALDSGLRDFLGRSEGLPLAEWPLQFWTSLLKQPVMLARQDRADELAHFTPGPRAALLLRLIAGLDFTHASQVLGVSAQAYEVALRNALDHREMDDARMQTLRDHLHQQIHQMPVAQRQALAELRSQAMAELIEQPSFSLAAARSGAGGRRWLWVALATLGLLLLGTFLWPGASTLAPGRNQILPREVIAPVPALTDPVIVTHPDYHQLAKPEEETIAASLGLLSWIATAGPGAGVQLAPPPERNPADFTTLYASEQALLSSARAAWPSLDAASRIGLVENARDWLSRSTAERESLRGRIRGWDQQAPLDRARRRAGFSAWLQLPDPDRQRVRAAGVQLSVMPALQQAELRAQFAALPSEPQRLWSMGPTLGHELAPVASMFAFIPEDQRPALLAALGGLDAQARADLGMLAPRLDETRRQALRRDLLAAPAAQRGALIRARLAQ